MYHNEVDGHCTFGSFVAATPAEGIPAGRRSLAGQPFCAHGFVAQHPWKDGSDAKHSYL